jgi:hypothetical protein
VNAAADPARNATEPPGLTTVDRYYLAWKNCQTHHRDETPSSTREAEQLSACLAAQGLHGRNGSPINPATLRRYLLPFRLYALWALQRQHTDIPSPETIARQCAHHGITSQYNKPVTTRHITQHATDFERRWQALTSHHTNEKQPPHPGARSKTQDL